MTAHIGDLVVFEGSDVGHLNMYLGDASRCDAWRIFNLGEEDNGSAFPARFGVVLDVRTCRLYWTVQGCVNYRVVSRVDGG